MQLHDLVHLVIQRRYFLAFCFFFFFNSWLAIILCHGYKWSSKWLDSQSHFFSLPLFIWFSFSALFQWAPFWQAIRNGWRRSWSLGQRADDKLAGIWIDFTSKRTVGSVERWVMTRVWRLEKEKTVRRATDTLCLIVRKKGKKKLKKKNGRLAFLEKVPQMKKRILKPSVIFREHSSSSSSFFCC